MIMSRKMNIEYACYSSSKEEKLILHSSFSSTLLEAIYRSIDAEEQSDDTVMYGAETSTRNKKKQSSASSDYTSKREEIEKWMEKRTVSTGSHDNPRQKPLEVKFPTARYYGPLSSSTHCSADSSSLERDYYPTPISKSKSTNSGYQMPNSPTRSASTTSKVQHHSGTGASRGSHFVKTKSHALKFYKELKKMKQPISPGGRLATMINSLFLTGHSKKAKFTNESDHEGPHTQHQPNNVSSTKSACSSASSFSRSCLSQKTSSSSASSTNKATRSVRFSDEKPIKMDESCDMHTDDIHALLKRYQNEDLFAIYNEFEEDEDEDGVSSCGSSDLFELDHLLGPVGMEELPVYETTRLESNRPIANSLLA